jgi:parallel beta-helix repeat protein
MGKIGKTFAVVLVLIFFMSSVLYSTSTVKAQTRTLTVPDQYPTIQEAIGNASHGDTVYVKTGIYYTYGFGGDGAGLTIDKSISLIGQDSKNTILRPHWEGYSIFQPHAGILVTADNVTISGFMVDGRADNGTLPEEPFFKTPYKGYQAEGIIIANNASGCEVNGNILLNSGQYQLEDDGSNSLITNNTFTSDNSLQVFGDSGVKFNSSNSIFAGNTVTQMGYVGVRVWSSENLTIKQNKITDNGINCLNDTYPEKRYGGLELSNHGNGSVNVYGNNITANTQYGVKFHSTNNCHVYSNEIENNGVGVYLPKYVDTPKDGFGNEFYLNNILENSTALIEETYVPLPYGNSTEYGADHVSWDNGKVGNYWSDYNGTGSYVIDENNVDHHPLTQQVDISATAPTPSPVQPNKVLILTIVIVVVLALVVSLLLYRMHRKTANLKQ